MRADGRTFRAAGDGRVVAELSGDDVDLLRALREDLHTLVTGEHDPDDPVVSRLFPPRVGDDVDEETVDALHTALLESRLAGLDAVVDVLDRARVVRRRHRLELVDDEPALFLGVLNDLRLALGARIGVETLDPDEVGEDADVLHVVIVMDHLGMWVDDLVAAIDPSAAAWQQDHHGPL